MGNRIRNLFAATIGRYPGSGDESATVATGADDAADTPSTRLFECPDCGTVYIATELESCSDCGTRVDRIPSERELGLLPA